MQPPVLDRKESGVRTGDLGLLVPGTRRIEPSSRQYPPRPAHIQELPHIGTARDWFPEAKEATQ